jgi:hypothetical protein
MVIRSDILFDKELKDHLIVDVGDTNVVITGFEIISKNSITKEQMKRLVKKYIPTSMYIASKKHPTFSVTPYSEVERVQYYPPVITREKVRMTPEYVAKNISRGCIQDVAKDLYYPITVYWPKNHKPSETFMEEVLREIKKINNNSKDNVYLAIKDGKKISYKVKIYNGALRSYNNNTYMMTFNAGPLVKDQARKTINRFIKKNWDAYFYAPGKGGYLKTKKQFEDLVRVSSPKKKSPSPRKKSPSPRKKSPSPKKKTTSPKKKSELNEHGCKGDKVKRRDKSGKLRCMEPKDSSSPKRSSPKKSPKKRKSPLNQYGCKGNKVKRRDKNGKMRCMDLK